MLSNNDIKFIRALHQKKFREESGSFIVEGEKVVDELLKSDWEIEMVCAVQEWYDNHVVNEKIRQEEITDAILGKISALSTPNKVLAVVKQKSFEINYDKKGITLFLDDVRDPGNLGTILRTADWFGIKQVICSETSVDFFNPKVVQSTMGSLFHIPFIAMNPEKFIPGFRENDIPVYGAEMKGESAFSERFPESLVLVMGSESHGISGKITQFIDKTITIPSFGASESLNVSIATGILCALIRRNGSLS